MGVQVTTVFMPRCSVMREELDTSGYLRSGPAQVTGTRPEVP
jgi:hypothetical protein